MIKIIVMCLMTLMLFSCSKEYDLYNDGYNSTKTIEAANQEKETTLGGCYYLDVPYNSCTDSVKAYVTDDCITIMTTNFVAVGDGYANRCCQLQYTIQDDKIVFGGELIDALETLYIDEINQCKKWIDYWGGKHYDADMLEFFTNRLNKVANERKAFMTSVGTTVTRWDIELVGDVYKTDNGVKIVIHGKNGLSKEYLFVN